MEDIKQAFNVVVGLLESLPIWLYLTIVVHFVVLGSVAYMILLERKVASWVQDRRGPNRVGPKGLLQPIADGIKFLVKEDYRPRGVDGVLFTLAPMLIVAVAILSVAVIPWGGTLQRTARFDITAQIGADKDPQIAMLAARPGSEAHTRAADAAMAMLPAGSTVRSGDLKIHVEEARAQTGIREMRVLPPRVEAEVTYRTRFQIASLNIGALFILAVLSLSVYGVVLGGWASNNKYSFLGGMRATAQMVSYEIPLGVSLLCVVVVFGTLDLAEIVDRQAHYYLGFIPAWNVFTQPLAFVLFLICIHAEANRAPFDLAECEQELVGGYHTEYSSMRFALFFLAEYAAMITTSAFCVALFFGGWHFPGLDGPSDDPGLTQSLLLCVARSAVFFGKVILVMFVFMWVRWSLPRFRFDQLMGLAWRGLIPLSLLLLTANAIMVWWFGNDGRAHMRVGGRFGLALLAVNIAIAAIGLAASRIIPPAPNTNRRIAVPSSRFANTPLPAVRQAT